MIALQIILCILIADFITGFGHWFEDAYSTPRWWLLGKLVAEPNIEHHNYPAGLVAFGSPLTRNWIQVLAASAVCLVAWLVNLLTWQLALVAALTAFGNEVHAWAHMNRAEKPWFVSLLHDMALVVTPSHHMAHHKTPYRVRYCVITNWVNPILDRLHFWGALEWIISLCGIHPKRLTAERRYV